MLKNNLLSKIKQQTVKPIIILIFASAIAVPAGAMADTITGVPVGTCPTHYSCAYQWHSVGVSGDNHVAYGNWRNCVGFAASPFTQEITCSTSQSTSDTVTASVTGTDNIGDAALSALVGYNVTQTTTVTTSDTVIVPAGNSGVVQWAPQYHNQKIVTQNDEWCWRYIGTGGFWTCEQTSRADQYAYTEQYSNPAYRTLRY